ncbi:hypothetical protein F4778DRAFT_695221 [Xylariomycetidae sp. FL2044]|nr:hypothetical protein F4778DRAFT_695221 [Xylariomycetidae sp. FL2044]
MPVTVRPAKHPARPWTPKTAASAEEFLQGACGKEVADCKSIIQFAFGGGGEHLTYSDNGFVRAAYAAYSQHHHLTIRPEDVWFAILSQLTFHINAHAEELRSYFVAHEGRREIVVTAPGTLHTADFGGLAVQMTRAMEKHIVDPDLRGWVMPDFTTTEAADQVTAAVLMMGAMQKYFSYGMMLVCGIPSVTILGERDDWVKIRARLAKLTQLGKEPTQFAALLTPVLDYFLRSFDEPTDPEVISFWNRIADRTGGSGPFYMSGWITAFCFWDADGKCLYTDPHGPVDTRGHGRTNPGCDLDGVLFHRVDTTDIPAGFASVPVKVDDNGVVYKTKMVAGSMGIRAWSSGELLDESKSHASLYNFGPFSSRAPEPVPVETKVGSSTGLDSIQPVSGWWMYELSDD